MPAEDDSSVQYVSRLPPDEIERIRAWHERAYAVSRSRRDEVVDYLGLSLVIPASVQPITPTSHLLGEAVVAESREGERVLDMGTGCGVNACLAARNGAHVVAVDINPEALKAARLNARRNGVADRIDVRASDVFSDVQETFDLIVFDPPFRWFKPRDLTEAAITDEHYRAMTRFFVEARGRLEAGGRMLVFFGTTGDIGYLEWLMEARGFSWSELSRLEDERDGVEVAYSTFKVT